MERSFWFPCAGRGWEKNKTETVGKFTPTLPWALAHSFPSPNLESSIHENGVPIGFTPGLVEGFEIF